jgi:hypothetical protein
MKKPQVYKPLKPCTVLAAVLAALLMIVSNPAADDALRCSNRVVSLGATPPEITDKCGDPDYVEQWEEGGAGYIYQLFDYETGRYMAPRLLKGPVRMERWTYNFGSNKFVRYLTFQNGRLIKIKTGDKGSPGDKGSH